MMSRGYGRRVLGMMKTLDNCVNSSDQMNDPLVLGRDFVGEVLSVGRDVAHVEPGDRVWGVLHPSEQGSFTQHCVAGVSGVSAAPESVSPVQCVSIPYCGLTGWSALQCAGVRRGQHVVVVGGAGGVGTLVTQLLSRYYNCQVTVLASSRHHAMLQQLGAETTIDNREDPAFAQNIEKADSIIDCAGIGVENIRLHLPSLSNMLRPGGSFVTLTSPVLRNTDSQGLIPGAISSLSSIISHNCAVSGHFSLKWAFFQPDIKALKLLKNLVDDGTVVPVIGKVIKFDELPEHLDNVKEGKIVVDIN